MAVAATTVKKTSEDSPIKRASRRRCERKQTPRSCVIETRGRSWEKTVEDAHLLEERFGFRVVLQGVIKSRQVIEAGGHLGMLRPQNLLPDCQRTLGRGMRCRATPDPCDHPRAAVHHGGDSPTVLALLWQLCRVLDGPPEPVRPGEGTGSPGRQARSGAGAQRPSHSLIRPHPRPGS